MMSHLFPVTLLPQFSNDRANPALGQQIMRLCVSTYPLVAAELSPRGDERARGPAQCLAIQSICVSQDPDTGKHRGAIRA
jgi:hypothetical protein